jgi:hypothetical protein
VKEIQCSRLPKLKDIQDRQNQKLNKAMATYIFRHKVGNIDTWLKGHDDRVKLFSPASSGFRTFQDADDPNSILLMVETDDIEKLGAVINDPKNQQIKEIHTVLEPITMSAEVKV